MSSLDRRRFLTLLVAAAAAAACSGDDGGGSEEPGPAAGDPLTAALATLGAAVRRAAPDLEPLELGVDPGDPAALEAAVAAVDVAARDDLAAGDTVEVAGWVLSVTEARLCLAVAR